MRIKSSVGLAVGPVNDMHWGQVLVLPNAYGIVEIHDAQGNAQQVGIQVLSRLGAALSRDLSSLEMVEDVVDKVFISYVQSLILLVPVGRVVYLVLKGEGAIYVKRGGELASLMHQSGGISGEVKEGDIFLLVSHGFSQVLSHDELTVLFDHLSPPDIAEKLTLLLHEKKGGEGSVALVFGATQLEESELADVTTDKPSALIEEKPVNKSKQLLLSLTSLLVTTRRRLATIRHQPKKMTALLVIFLVSLFLLCVTLGIVKQTTLKKNQEVVAAVSDAQHAFDEGVALLSLNPVKGRERLSTAKQLLDPYIHTISSRTTEGYQMNALYQKITDNLTQAMQVVDRALTIFYDMSLLKKGAIASTMALDGQTLVIGDQATDTIYALDIVSKKARITGGGDMLNNLSFVAIHGDTYYTLTNDGIVSIRSSDTKSSLIIKNDNSWGKISSILSFGGNIYLLDTTKSRIWKYVATDTSASADEAGLPAGRQGFSEMREYLNPDTLPDLSQATSMAIDGSVWLGTANGKILRFTQGKDNTFVPKGVDPVFGTKLAVYTSDDVKNIYVLDSQNNRVVVLDKEGMYVAQYRWSGAVVPSDLVVSEQEKKILLLASGTIYFIDLK